MQTNTKWELTERSLLVLKPERIKKKGKITSQFVQPAVSVKSISSLNSARLYRSHILLLMKKYTSDSPFGIEQVTDLLIVDLHEGHLHLKSMGLIPLSADPLKQRATESRY